MYWNPFGKPSFSLLETIVELQNATSVRVLQVSHFNSQLYKWRNGRPEEINELLKVTYEKCQLPAEISAVFCNPTLPILVCCAGTSEAHGFSRTVVILYHASFKYGFSILTLSPFLIPGSSSGIITAWFGTLKSVSLANSSKSLSLIFMPFPSHSRSQPSPSGRAVKIFSGYEPPSWTSSLFFKPKHQCHVHMHMSHKFF